MEEFADFKKYKWFYTLSEKLIIAGKSSEQNDSMLKKVKSLKKEFIIMHTSSPGSPFSVILSNIEKVNKDDIEECAVFTACFSRAWKSGKKKASVDIFSSNQLRKSNEMKSGTWGVIGKVKRLIVPLLLTLTIQDSTMRAVPEKSIKNKKEILLKICPGKISKEDFITKLAVEIGEKFSQTEILSALPAGGIKISR